jgi:hypothetical protein
MLTDRQMDGEIDRHIEKEKTHGHSSRQTDRQKGTQAHRHTGR